MEVGYLDSMEDTPESGGQNGTSPSVNLDDIKMDSNFVWLMISLLFATFWVVYITYYHSRILGYIITKLINRKKFLSNGCIKIGSFTWSVLSGKIMFRDIVYINNDYTVRIQDGLLIFRWWRAYIPKHVSEDLSHSDTRLSILLNGYELHMYNRTNVYSNLERLFGLEPSIIPKDELDKDNNDADTGALTTPNSDNKSSGIKSSTWRDLIPVIKVDVSSGRVVFGNRLIPTTLSINVEEAHFVYSTKPAASRLDHFMHITKCKAENLKVILANSPKYVGMNDEPPRFMGEGFVVVSSNSVEMYSYMDEPGVVPEEPEMLQLANGDIVESSPPIWGVDIKFGKGTDFSYGPWADRQREHIFKFFFPTDYQTMEANKPPLPGEKRIVQSFDIRLSTLKNATIDVLFSKNKETNAVHVNIKPGSYMEITIPWAVQQDGYRTKIMGQLLHVEATTSLLFGSLLASETLEFNVKCHYPLKWNDHQDWTVSLTGCKATCYLMYAHVEFFQDLVRDWSNKSPPDLLHFVPYTVKFNALMKEFEVILSCNRYNWIDCLSQNHENNQLAVCGELFDLSFDLPFVDFLPQTVPVRLWIQGESVDMCLFIPEANTCRNVVSALDGNKKILGRDGNIKTSKKEKKWRKVCDYDTGWIDCWSVPIVALCINYVYHPVPPLGPPPQANITTPEKEELLLSPMRMPGCRKSPGIHHWKKNDTRPFDPTALPPDKVGVELEIGSSVLLVYGSWVRNFVNLKENIFGDDQKFCDMKQKDPTSSVVNKDETESVNNEDEKIRFDARKHRPMEVVVSVTMHDIQAHLVKNCNDKDPPCPMILIDRFGFEMKKNYNETILQVLLSPSVLLISDSMTRPNKDGHLSQGHLMLSGLQIRGHAMFSDEGRSLDEETLEYAWMIEVSLGILSGKLSPSQLYHLVTSLQTLLLLVKNDENELRSPTRSEYCVHGAQRSQCTGSDLVKHTLCPTSDDIKYRMTRVAIDALDLYIVENGTCLHLTASPIRVANCNLHGKLVRGGVTAALPVIQVRQYMYSGVSTSNNHSNTNTATTSSGRSQHGARSSSDDMWLEIGSVTFSPVVIESAFSLSAVDQSLHMMQHEFLKYHDDKKKRLWFLWPPSDHVKIPGKCGCVGGCVFFGSNKNGRRFFKPSRQDIVEGINLASFRINPVITEPGFGQSILHEGQLVFHTPPYGPCDVNIQEPFYYYDTMSGTNLSDNLKVPSQEPVASCSSPNTKRIDGSKLGLDSASVSPSPVSDRKTVKRRFSCASTGNTKTGGSSREVPYARLVDHSPTSNKTKPNETEEWNSLGREKNKFGLIVPELEQHPRSSLSDSKLAVDYFQQSSSLPNQGTRSNLTLTSDSHHSLTAAGELVDHINQQVQRTTSLSSENQSEIFYSADEELSQNQLNNLAAGVTMINGGASSRNSLVGVLLRQDSTGRQSGVKINDHDKNSPRSSTIDPVNGLSSSPRLYSGNNHILEVSETNSHENILHDSSDTHSVSSTSFISAVSSQEDIGLVNLHQQVNRPIIESPLLMSSYINHLSQVTCSNWNRCSVPAGCDAYTLSGDLFQRTEEGYLYYVGAKYTPHFKTVTEGFTFLKMVSKVNDFDLTPPASAKTPTHPYQWENGGMLDSNDDKTKQDDEMLSVQCEQGNRTTLVVKVKGDIDVTVTPLVLESLQRFIDALTPTLATLHPLTIVNHLHAECIEKVKQVNVLKQNEFLNKVLPVAPSQDTKGKDKLTMVGSLVVESNTYQEVISTQTQGTVIVPKINITFLQTSVVEELIAFSALDNIRDLSCVSLFAVCVDNIIAKFHFGKQTKEILQSFYRPVIPTNQKKSGVLIRGARPFLTGSQRATVADTSQREPILVESSQHLKEEMVIVLNVGKLHAQLRRLPNESSVLKDAVVTAIPPQHSKVMFNCMRSTLPLRGFDYYFKNKDKMWTSDNIYEHMKDDLVTGDDKLGFIMFESGMEGVSLKIVKQDQFEKNCKEVKDSNVNETQKDNPTDKSQTISQTEQILSAMRFSTKPASSLSDIKSGKGKSDSKSAGEKTEVKQRSGSSLATPIQKQNSNTLSCVIEVSTVWFNFAAPPRTPITRKIDFTRLDWNLLSTAAPSINAWMNPSSRFALRLVYMFRTMYRRSSGVVSCLMADALEMNEIHVPIKSRYTPLTAMSKTLREDPSCQLCAILHTYVTRGDLSAIEADLTENHLPLLPTLRQGVIVLSRQWKNVLYTPLLLDHNFKTKNLKPMNVTFALPDTDDDNVLTDAENSGEENEITDERAVLINAEVAAFLDPIQERQFEHQILEGQESSLFTSPMSPSSNIEPKKKHLPNLQPPSSSRASIVFPIMSHNYSFTNNTNKYSSADQGYSMLKDDVMAKRLGSEGSIYSNLVPGSQQSVTSFDTPQSEDLYSWMTKQDTMKNEETTINMPGDQDSLGNNSGNNGMMDDPTNTAGYSAYPVHDSLCLLDAHLIFQPFLSSLGVTPQQMVNNNVSSGNSAMFESWGSNSSLVGTMDTLRIDIVVSEHGKTSDKRKGKSKSRKFYLELPSEVPAFLCEKIGVEVDIKKTADNDIFHKQNVLYVSRGHLKKHTSTRLNFSLNINYISQQVNMPLLRLLHQIASMYQNVKDTQMELKEQHLKGGHPASLTLSKEPKNGSSSTSDVQEPLMSSSLTDHLTKTPTPVIDVTKSTVSPSSSLLSRPQTLAQRLRSTSKSVKGYMNLNDVATTPLDVDKNMKPRCWRTLYYLLDLYATMPETKTVSHRFSVPADVVETYRAKRKFDSEGKQDETDKVRDSVNVDKQRDLSVIPGERTRLVVFGVARIHRTRLLATLSGLKLEAEITNLHSSVTYRKKLRPENLECSLTGQVGRTMIVLLEGVAPNQQTVVKVTVGKSQALYSSSSKRQKDKNSGLLTVGSVNIDIPQHPVALHGMMTRGSKQLSSTLQELGVTRASRISRGMTFDEPDIGLDSSPNHQSNTTTLVSDIRPKPETTLLVMQFSVILQSLSITAALLPSLQAQYKMDQVNSSGVTGGKAKFTVDLPRHSLSFTTKLPQTEAKLPPEASIDLPKIHVSAEYVQDGKNKIDPVVADGAVLRQGSYLNAVADIGKFEHSLTTDLLNHLVFVQKVFMKEVNEVVQKVYGGEKVVPIWQEEEETSSSSLRRILFSLVIRIKRVQLTATTPTNSAVRLETGAVEFQLSNRVENVSGSAQPNPYMKIFGKAQVDINLSLGQLLKNVMFEEAEPEFQQYAFFKTRIGLRNAFQGEMVQGEDKEVVLITLKRPLIYIQPLAVDKAILVWLNYKNAYEYWNEQRSDLNTEVQSATQQVFEKVPFGQLGGTLFLQLTVDDMGICIPLTHPPVASWNMSRTMYLDNDTRGAVVVTLESTSISACSSGSLVSKGRFVGLCFRFADDFETSLDDWKPDMNDSSIMNLCVVSEGTYEVCSRTTAQKPGGQENAKWFLNVQWQMEGVDIHLDVNVGKQLSALGHTLTTLTGFTEEDDIGTLEYDSDEHDGMRTSQESISLRKTRYLWDSLPASVLDPAIDAKKRSKLIEKEMHEQAKIINDLKCLGASHATVEQEVRRLQELEAMVFKDFRRDMIQKLRRQSVKASSIKEKFGLGRNSNSYRSRSFMIPSPTLENANELDSPDKAGLSSIRSVDNSGSFESSPRSGPSRSASLRVSTMKSNRVTFSDTHNICRQSSLPSGDSDMSIQSEVDWGGGLSHMDIDGEKVPLRKKHNNDSDDSTSTTLTEKLSGTSPGITPNVQKSHEPNIDFELDVKVFINSGKCVLHTKDQCKEEEMKLLNRMKKERSCSGGVFEFPPNSPNMGRRNKEPKQMSSSSRLRTVHGNTAQLVDLTIFHIPGLDVKVHYESKIEIDESFLSPHASLDLGSTQFRKPVIKKASLFAWTTLQSIPEETIISPHILEFLEQTLEPIPSSVPSAKDTFASSGNAVFGDSTTTGNYVYASFPVDVMVYFHMQPSTFRFSCLPVSRVECMLQLPSLDIVFSSKRAEEELSSEFGGSDPGVPSPSSAVGGVSVTGCLSDFSVYIFHPYGGGKKSGLKEPQWSPLSDSERKDSLSINVEFVKFHLSRSRKVNFQAEQAKTSSTSLDQSRAVIRFSTIIDIGSASFKYDMRRLTEILAFPKAWYRRSIVRRLFLGDLNISAIYSDDNSPHSSLDDDVALIQKNVDNMPPAHVRQSDRSPLLSRDRMKLNLPTDQSRSRFKEFGRMNTVQEDGSPSPEQNSRSGWETLVLFAINFKKLNVHMNMGNVMGNVMWLTKDFRSEGRLSIGSSGHKNMYIALGLGSSNLDAKGGIVGGTIELSQIDTFIHIREDPGTEPDHTVGLKLFALELRLDYMGTGVLMCRVSSLDVSLRDEWKIHSFKSTDSYIPTRRPAMIFIHGDLGWDQLQMMISKSTTADLLKMFYKLEEFFSQQFKSSKRVFSSLQSHALTKSTSFKKKLQRKSTIADRQSISSTFSYLQPTNHHRHWQKVLSVVCGMSLSSFKIPLPLTGTVLGGTMELHGNNISLACFHGINFKSKSWALFSMKEPCISFATEAQEIPTVPPSDVLDVHIVQTLTFSLGMTSDQAQAQHHSMATICRMSRNILFPPQYKSLQEWFHYAFCSSELDAVDRFPCLERDRSDTMDEQKRPRGNTKLQDPNHTREVIFALPSLQIHLKTEHLQSSRTPDVIDSKPVVECSFISEFEDHIFVTINAEGFFFLHDLITSYLNEKDKVVNSTQRTQSPEQEKKKLVSEDDKKKPSTSASFDPVDVFAKDWRTYECKTWHLEPTVRIWSWAGKSIEPYGVDYILQKLGFTHARTTIPKWMQRGFMDPLDKVLAVIMMHIISMVRDNTKKE